MNRATARLRLADARGLLARGIDPSTDRKQFKYLEVPVAKGLVSADTLRDATRILERHIFPELGGRPIGDIHSHELLRGAEANRTQGP